MNTVPVYVTDPNNPGTPQVDVTRKNNLYAPSEHVIVDIQRKANLFIGKNDETFTLDNRPGYKIVDYDYDKTSSFEYENITYSNTVEVEVTK